MRRLGEVPRIPRLARDAHKGDRGHVLIVAGSRCMSGAARLAGWGALRGGAGLVTIATPRSIQPVVAGELPCAMTLPLPESREGAFTVAAGREARVFADTVDAVVVGPGITTKVMPFLRQLVKGLNKPIAFDADALNLVAQDSTLTGVLEGPSVLTPHPGEASRLLGKPVGSTQQERIRAARELADAFVTVAVLKGAGTVVSDGEKVFVNRTGNPGMATGGTGDVLAGLLGARLASGADPFVAAVQSVHLHGRAGDLAAAGMGENAMIATDLVANLPAAVAELTEPGPRQSGSAQKRTASRRRGRGGR